MAPQDTNNRAPAVKVCSVCVHYRMWQEIALFDARELQSPGVLKAQTQWDQEQRQRAQTEKQRFLARQPFYYEPHSYAWCAAFSTVDLVARANRGDAAATAELMEGGGATMNPVTGELSPRYLLCAWQNPDGRCERYEPAG